MIQALQGAGAHRGGQGGTLEDLLKHRVVIAVEAASDGLTATAEGPSVHRHVLGAGGGEESELAVGPEPALTAEAPWGAGDGQDLANAHRGHEGNARQRRPGPIAPGFADHGGLHLGAELSERVELGMAHSVEHGII